MGADHVVHNEEDGLENVPLTDTQRTVVTVVHYLAFVFGAVIVWAFLRRIDTLRNRIWSPFLLLTGLIWLQVATALEIGNHYYEGNWELAGFPSDLVNGSFYFFNFGAQYLNSLGLRRKGLPFFRWPSRKDGEPMWRLLLDATALLFDMLMVIGVVSTAPLYAALGRDSAISLISAFGAIAGVGTVFRLWKNLGPNSYTLWGGMLFLAFALLGVGMASVYMNTGIEWLHVFIGLSFVTSLIPFTVAILHAEDLEPDGEDEEVDLESADSLLKDDHNVDGGMKEGHAGVEDGVTNEE